MYSGTLNSQHIEPPPQVSSCTLLMHITHCLLPVADCVLHNVFCLLPLLPVVNCPRQVARCMLHVSSVQSKWECCQKDETHVATNTKSRWPDTPWAKARRIAYRLLLTDCILPVAYCLLPVAYCLLPVACCLLPIAYCMLHIAYCLLHIAYCLLHVGGAALQVMQSLRGGPCVK